jgi:hypothetical protein
MPHRSKKQHLKLTGDTHAPELESGLGPDEATDFDDPAQARPAGMGLAAADGANAGSSPAGRRDAEPAALASAREFARAQPLAALGIALAAGWALSKLLRR